MELYRYERKDHDGGNHCWCRPIIVDLGYMGNMLIRHRRVAPQTLAARYEHIRVDEDESSGQACTWNNDYGLLDG